MPSSAPPPPEPSRAAALVQGTPRFTGPRPTPPQQRFNRLLERSDALAARLAEVQALGERIHQQDARQLEPLRAQRDELLRQMALHLEQRLGRPGLARSQQQQARELLCGIAAELAERGDEAMRALHDAHSPTPWDARHAPPAQQGAGDAEAPTPEAAGAGPAPDDDPEARLHAQEAARERLREEARAAHQARRRQAAQKKKAGGGAAPLDPDSALRTLYRQLARHLHPDREQDAQARVRKTALMGDANKAYAQRDLPTLLRLQHTAGEVVAAPPADERLQAMNALLQERVEHLNATLQSAEHALRQSFGMHPRDPVNEAALRRHLGYDRADLAEDIAQLRGELRGLDDEDFFRRWLRSQHKLWQQGA